MPATLRRTLQYLFCLLAGMLTLNLPGLHAAGPPLPSSMDNPLAIGFVILMFILLLVIGLLANLLLGVAQVNRQKEKEKEAENNAAAKTVALSVVMLLLAGCLSAQTPEAAATAETTNTIAGLSTQAFYLMASVIFLELLIIVVLLINVRILLRVEKEGVQRVSAIKRYKAKWAVIWAKLNSFKPVEKEADIDLGHDYDGIRELDNRLPPWWLYGFYITIVVACIYFYRYHISHTGPSSKQEYELAVATADMQVKEYLKQKGESVDENTVTLLTAPGDIEEGKTFFTKSCVACHNEGGAGNVGPNLTDDYWLHGGDIKSIFKTIRYGINAMPQWQNSYSNKQIAELASYVKSLHGTHPANPKAAQGTLFKEEGDAKPAADSTGIH
ncbi:MAG: cbb3-type cytochrome c oxidase N-terminal domain-containing protein [Chitinophagaceae bacterium]